MKLTGIQVDGFGVWRDLDLPDIGEGMTAFYGPNEAGKTTVLQFIRAMLYGPSPACRQRYLPAVSPGKTGGWLTLEGTEERLHLGRRFSEEDEAHDRWELVAESGQPRAREDLEALLGRIDEATFNNVFALGLRELQELGTLSDTEAANWLYRLTTGLDRVSLLEVMQNLEKSRESLLARDGSGGLIKTLVSRRAQLVAQVDQETARHGVWSQLHVRIEQVTAEICKLRERRTQLAEDCRTLEIALQLLPRWRDREDLCRRLEALSGAVRLPADAIEKLDALKSRIHGHQQEAKVLKGQRQALKDEADQLGINEVLVRNASRVRGLGEQRDWLEALERQSASIAAELSEIQSQLATENDRLGVELQAADRPIAPEITEDLLQTLRPHAKAMKACREHLLTVEREAASRLEAREEYEAQLKVAMPASSEGMPTDLEEAGELVASYRRRLQIEQRMEQARRTVAELEEQYHELLDREELPVWMEAAHTVLIMVGVALFTIGLLASAPAAAWIGGVMLAVLIALRIFKYIGQEQVASRRDRIERQIESLTGQVNDAEVERDALETELGPVDGSVVVKLQAAERHFAELEKLLPIDAKLRDARREAESADRRVHEARRRLEAAQSTWKSKLASAGLPKDWTPADLRVMAGRYEQISDLRLRVTRRREDAQQRQREHATLCERIQNLAEEVGLVIDGSAPLTQLEHLLSELRGHQTRLASRRRLRKRAGELKTRELRHRRAAAALVQQRDALFQRSGVSGETAFRKLVERQQHIDELVEQRTQLTREINAMIAGHADEATFARLLASQSHESLERIWEETASDLEALEQQLQECVEQRGAANAQLQSLAEDLSPMERRLELACIDAQLEEAIVDWQMRASVCTVLERIRAFYEKNRQPETLVEASRIFEGFTAGRYRRIWTPLAKNLLFVDTVENDSLPVEILSRGTREQLFLALRLALVALMARRGVSLPLILDDVLVNFDAERSSRAAQALVDFAAGGHQVLLFTCHKHIADYFASLGVDVREMPNRWSGEADLLAKDHEPVRIRAEPTPVDAEDEIETTSSDNEATVPDSLELPEHVLEEAIEEDTVLDDDESPVEQASPSTNNALAHQSAPAMWTDWIRVGPQVRRRTFVEEQGQEHRLGRVSQRPSDTAARGEHQRARVDGPDSQGEQGKLEAA